MITRSRFINRKKEMKFLEKIANSPRAELVIMYGRRRVGKTRLLNEFRKKTRKKVLYLIADLSENILDILGKQIREKFVRFSNWEDFYDFLLKSDYEIIIIDEFQYLYHVNRAFPTQLQRWWEKLKEKNKKIILCGSLISTIYKISIGYGSALYGRKTYEVKIEPLKFKYIKDFFPKYSMEDLVNVYSVLGGVPKYLEEFDPELPFWENVKTRILAPNTFLYNEPNNIFFEEFKNPAPYFGILLAISQGYRKFSRIASYSRINENKLTKYLIILERIGVIEKEIPVTEKRIKTKFTLYKIKDNFFNFWFRFVYPNKSLLELENLNEVLESVKREFRSYVSFVFEDICREFLIETKPISFTKIGKWWHKDKEIDILALNEKTKEILFAECKWQEKVNAKKICKELAEKAQYVKWHNAERKESFAIFAKSFSKRISEFEGKRVYCFDLKELGKTLNRKEIIFS